MARDPTKKKQLVIKKMRKMARRSCLMMKKMRKRTIAFHKTVLRRKWELSLGKA
jgi:hypothetical protein